ncbi:MAG: TrkA family potassium uptake protein [Thermodesulfobacteriota bacterium]
MPAPLQIGVIGLGKFGYTFGKTLIKLGQSVLGVDSNAANVARAQQVFTQVFQAEASNKKALQQMGFADLSHVLVSVGDSIAASTMITMYLKELGVPSVWVKAINSDHEKLLRKVGADEVIIPEHLAAKQLANRIANPGFIEYLPFDQKMALKELIVEHWAGRSLREIDLTNRFGVQVVAIRQAAEETFRFIPRANDRLGAGDRLVVIGAAAALAKIEP